ncbi:hypothetical protein DFH28DRAFT_942713, partial [Melampsora americana]
MRRLLVLIEITEQIVRALLLDLPPLLSGLEFSCHSRDLKSHCRLEAYDISPCSQFAINIRHSVNKYNTGQKTLLVHDIFCALDKYI